MAAYGLDHARAFMTENQRRRGAQLAAVGVQVGVTNSRGVHPHKDLGVFGVV